MFFRGNELAGILATGKVRPSSKKYDEHRNQKELVRGEKRSFSEQ
jgi:hypothetical protein